jgi:hypothetical protein
MKDRYDVVVVGSGPSAIGLAHKISSNSSKSVLIIEKLNVQNGGMRNDCKISLDYRKSFPEEYWTEESANYYLKEVEEYLKLDFKDVGDISYYTKQSKKYGIELIASRQVHIGTDRSLELINRLINGLKENNVEILLNTEMVSLKYNDRYIVLDNGNKIGFTDLCLCTGRKSATWIQNIMKEEGIEFIDNTVDIGIRIEMRKDSYNILEHLYDPKFVDNINKVRSFCTNSGHALVVKEKYKDFYSLNGHALSSNYAPNGLANFALLKTITLTEPVVSGNDYAKIVGKTAMNVGGGNPIMQRLCDFRDGVRSKVEKFENSIYGFSPTLKTCTAGDIALAAPMKIISSIWSTMKKLDSVCYGVMSPQNVLYYPEIKKYMNKPKFMDNNFQVKDNLYIIGDVGGISRGISAAMASGLKVGDYIIKTC